MRIRWNSDFARQMLRQMREASQSLQDCLQEARRAAEQFGDAGLGSDSTVRRYETRMNSLIRRMNKCADRIDQLMEGTGYAKDRFEEVEREVRRLFEEIGDPVRQDFVIGNPEAAAVGAVAAIGGWESWPTLLMPEMRINSMPIAPDWLTALAADTANFNFRIF